MQPPERIGKRLRLTRKHLGYEGRASEFAEAIDVLPSALSQWENAYEGRVITLEAAIRLCGRFRLTLDWVYRGDPSGLPQTLAGLTRDITE
jgi:transcriptional regulator with XRE-family HTH domain